MHIRLLSAASQHGSRPLLELVTVAAHQGGRHERQIHLHRVAAVPLAGGIEPRPDRRAVRDGLAATLHSSAHRAAAVTLRGPPPLPTMRRGGRCTGLNSAGQRSSR
jgi:hypothetical protein